MKKSLLSILFASVFALSLVSCKPKPEPEPDKPDTPVEPVVNTYTVAFEVDGTRFKTFLKVKENSKIEKFDDPSKTGFDFDGWYDGTTKLDFDTYTVTKDVTFSARFTEKAVTPADPEVDNLVVDATKEDGKEYYLVLGWYEGIDADGKSKDQSGLTSESVKVYYSNIVKYLKAYGATNEQIANVQMRNYSFSSVADMGAKVNSDNDVDLLIGVGVNVFTTAGCQPYNVSDDSKFSFTYQIPGNTKTYTRYVGILKGADQTAMDLYKWLERHSDVNLFEKKTAEEINALMAVETINVIVKVHGDSVESTQLDSEDKVITMPTITVVEGKVFKGFATSEGGSVVLEVNKDATLKYKDIKDLVVNNALDLYPVIEDAPVVEEDLVVYIQVNGNNLTMPEAELLRDRFLSTLNGENVRIEIKNAAAAAFKEDVPTTGDWDVLVGGNSPLKDYPANATYPLVNAGKGHFVSENRKVVVKDGTTHSELAAKFYNFVTSEAPTYDVLTAFWTKGGSWVTAENVTKLTADLTAKACAYMNVENAEALKNTYNVTISFEEVTTDGNKVADLGPATEALREGKGADFVIGCGNNINSDTGAKMTIVDKKTIDTSYVGVSGRYVAMVHENLFTTEFFNNYFVEVNTTPAA